MGNRERTADLQRMLKRWEELKVKNPTAVSEWLSRIKGYKKIILYTEESGELINSEYFSKVGESIVEELLKSDELFLEYIITDTPNNIVDIPSVSPDSISAEVIKDVDAIVVVQHHLTKKVREQLSNKEYFSNIKVYSMAEIILEMWKYEVQKKSFEDVSIESRIRQLFEAQDYDAIKRLVLPSKVRDSEGEGSIEGEKYD